MHDQVSDNPIMRSENPLLKKPSAVKRRDAAVSVLLRVVTYFILICAAYIFWDITKKGAPVVFKTSAPFVNTSFFTKSPETLMTWETEAGKFHRMDFTDYSQWKRDNPEEVIVEEKSHAYSGGGIFGPLVGTALLTLICIVVALFVGLTTAVFLNEYSSKGRFMDMIRLAIMNLAGVPSIVFGLFGLMFFCLFVPVLTQEPLDRSFLTIPLGAGNFIAFQGWGTCMLAGGFTLAVMILPVIIAACEESLKAIPMGFREASLALGATKWQSISKSVLPYAFPGMLTASVLGITRVAGETAPIMFTAALAHKDKLPWQEVSSLTGFFSQSVQAMPYHIYTVAARIPQTEYTKPMQYGSVFVFMVLVMALAALSVYLRINYRKRLKW
ncbi:MAG: phosphate ABC transporter permease PstA [Verrucomicrobiales bacterium]|nr:phosphate ABC transporter permease PstA [Verrucomicrobiales bacterium]